MNRTNWLVAVAVVVSVVALGFGVFGGHTTVVTQPVGSVTGPVIPFPYLTTGGITHFYGHTNAFANSTSTIFGYQAPAATSTLASATCEIYNGTASTQTFELGRTTGYYGVDNSGATTTALAYLTLGASKYGELVATTSVTQLTDGVVIPYSWLNVKVASGTPGTLDSTHLFTGGCNVILRAMAQ